MDGLIYMFRVEPEKLYASKTWIDGASQVYTLCQLYQILLLGAKFDVQNKFEYKKIT